MNTSEILNRAADLIQEHGWGTGPASASLLNENSSGLCLEGGIAAAAGIEQLQINLDAAKYAPASVDLHICPAYRAVQGYLDIAGSLWAWNDKRGRTADEVIEVLRAAALIESAKEARRSEVGGNAENLGGPVAVGSAEHDTEAQESAWATYADNLAAVAS